MLVEEAPERADPDLEPALVRQALLHLVQRDVVLAVDQTLQELGFRLDATRAAVPAHWQGIAATCPILPAPTHRRGNRDPEPLGRRMGRGTLAHRPQHPMPKINR